jgi:hypothetical protein
MAKFLFGRKYSEQLVKRQITDVEHGAASAAALKAVHAGKDRRAIKRAGLKALRNPPAWAQTP